VEKDTKELTIIKNKDWNLIKDQWLRVIEFNPLAKIENGKIVALSLTTPYALIKAEGKNFPQKINVFITHKIDFTNLWKAFKENPLTENEEVLIICPGKSSKAVFKLFSAVMPKMVVMICSKDAFKLEADSNYKPELTGEARWNAMKPIEEFKPDIFNY